MPGRGGVDRLWRWWFVLAAALVLARGVHLARDWRGPVDVFGLLVLLVLVGLAALLGVWLQRRS